MNDNVNDSENRNLWQSGGQPLSGNAPYHDPGSIVGQASDSINASAQTPQQETAAQPAETEQRQATPPPQPPETSGSAPAEPPKPKKKRPVKKWAMGAGAILLAAAIALGGGYAGVQLAYSRMDRVIIRQVAKDEGTASDGTASDSAALTSEQVADKTTPSVVAIVTEQMTTSNFWFGSSVTGGAGSGVILTEDGYIVTNYHVVSGADSIKVELSDGTTKDANVVGTYIDGDLAVIKIDASGLIPVTFADSESVKQGAKVYAVGNPEGTFSDSITSGIISVLDRTISETLDDGSNSGSSGNSGNFNPFFGFSQSTGKTVNLTVFQFDAAVSPGNSGGGLFNDQGELIGIVCAKSSDTEAEGLSFAIVGNNVQKAAESLISTGSYAPSEGSTPAGNDQTVNTNKAILGITAATLDQSTAQQYGYQSAGVYIVSITEESASKAGLAVGDRIISVDGVMVSQTSDVTDYLADKEPGDTVEVAVERSGKMMTCTVPLQNNGDAA